MSRWGRGNYGAIGTQLSVIAERLCETVDLRAGRSVLDVATGTGNAALAAARRNCIVTGVDSAPELLDHARRRAEVEGLAVEFRDGDAEDLPFPDDSFDFVISTLGVQFVADQQKAARELRRVCRNTIGLSNWTPGGFSTAYSDIVARYMPPSDAPSPYAWGEPDGLRDLGFEPRLFERVFRYRFPRPEDWLQCFRDNFGPMMALYESLEPDRQEALTAEIDDAVARFNEADDGTLVLPIAYVDVLAQP